MGRFFSPTVFLAAGYWVLYWNKTHPGKVVIFPFIDVVYPAAANDLALQGRITGFGCIVIGSLMMVRAIVSTISSRRDAEES